MLESQADGSPYLYLKVLTTPYKIRAPFWAPFHDLTSIIPHKTMAGKKKKSRTNQVFMRLSGTLCDCIKYVKPFASDAKEYYFLYQGGHCIKNCKPSLFIMTVCSIFVFIPAPAALPSLRRPYGVRS